MRAGTPAGGWRATARVARETTAGTVTSTPWRAAGRTRAATAGPRVRGPSPRRSFAARPCRSAGVRAGAARAAPAVARLPVPRRPAPALFSCPACTWGSRPQAQAGLRTHRRQERARESHEPQQSQSGTSSGRLQSAVPLALHFSFAVARTSCPGWLIFFQIHPRLARSSSWTVTNNGESFLKDSVGPMRSDG